MGWAFSFDCSVYGRRQGNSSCHSVCVREIERSITLIRMDASNLIDVACWPTLLMLEILSYKILDEIYGLSAPVFVHSTFYFLFRILYWIIILYIYIYFFFTLLLLQCINGDAVSY